MRTFLLILAFLNLVAYAAALPASSVPATTSPVGSTSLVPGLKGRELSSDGSAGNSLSAASGTASGSPHQDGSGRGSVRGLVRRTFQLPGMGGAGGLGGLDSLGGLGGLGGLGSMGGLGGLGGMSNAMSTASPSSQGSSSPMTGLMGLLGMGGGQGSAGSLASTPPATADTTGASAPASGGSAPETATRAGSGDCPPLYLIFARGTTEMQGTFGIVGRPLCTGLQQAVPGTQCYDTVYSSSMEYMVSPGEGANTASRFMAGITAKCPRTKFVLGGYSKGAMVVHQIRGQNVVGAVTFGDPLKAQQVQSTSKVQIFCHAGDPVCMNGVMFMAHMTYNVQDVPQAVQFLAEAYKSSGQASGPKRRSHHGKHRKQHHGKHGGKRGLESQGV